MNKIEVCMGPMCALSGGRELLDFLEKHASNGVLFKVSPCDCMGASSEAPVVFINGEQRSEVSIESLEEETKDLV